MGKQIIQSSQTNAQRVEIKSLEEMESFLENLQATASDSLAAALSAQLQVIRYVSSSQLVGTTFDTLFKNLKKAKEYAATPKERDMIMEKGSLMIQNYVFFMKAKLVYAIEDNKREGQKLFEEAGMQLSKSVVDIGTACYTGGANLSIAVANNLFQNSEKNLGLFARFLNWWNKEEINLEKQEEFYKSLELLIEKLNRNKEVIGKSDIIAGLVENYADDLTYNVTSDYQMSYLAYKEKKDTSLRQIGTVSLSLLGFSVIFLILRWIWHGIQDMGSGVMSWFSDGVEKISRDGWVSTHFMWTGTILAFVALIFFIIYLVRRQNCKKAENNYAQRYYEVRDYYSSIAANFEEE